MYARISINIDSLANRRTQSRPTWLNELRLTVVIGHSLFNSKWKSRKISSTLCCPDAMSSNQRGTWGGKGRGRGCKLCTFLTSIVARTRLLSASVAMARFIVHPRCECYPRKQNILIVVCRRFKVASVSSPFPRSTTLPRFFVSQPSDAQVSKYLSYRANVR